MERGSNEKLFDEGRSEGVRVVIDDLVDDQPIELVVLQVDHRKVERLFVQKRVVLGRKFENA